MLLRFVSIQLFHFANGISVSFHMYPFPFEAEGTSSGIYLILLHYTSESHGLSTRTQVFVQMTSGNSVISLAETNWSNVCPSKVLCICVICMREERERKWVLGENCASVEFTLQTWRAHMASRTIQSSEQICYVASHHCLF